MYSVTNQVLGGMDKRLEQLQPQDKDADPDGISPQALLNNSMHRRPDRACVRVWSLWNMFEA